MTIVLYTHIVLIGEPDNIKYNYLQSPFNEYGLEYRIPITLRMVFYDGNYLNIIFFNAAKSL
jgi:hypothetical protein